MENESRILQEIQESIRVMEALASQVCAQITEAVSLIVPRIRGGNKLILFGNGGSAADAQHIAAEFVGRYLAERDPLPAIALTTNTSALTAIGNDYGFEEIFPRQIQALARPGDFALGISTSWEFGQRATRLGNGKAAWLGHTGFHP